jgi:hypothetical protein
VLLGATDLFAVVAAGVFSGVIEGVTLPVPVRRVSYGPAVAGRVNSGLARIGRRTVPAINEPVPVGLDANADFVELPKEEGGRATEDDAVDAVETVREPSDLDDCDLAGV